MTKILIVDDSETLRMTLSNLLADAGYQVIEAENGAMGLEIWGKYHSEINMVITDYNMPEMDGMSMVRKLRGLPDGKNILVFMLTTESSQELKEMGKEYGIRAWVTKPFSHEKLLMAIKKVLS